MYGFKVKDRLTIISKKLTEELKPMLNKKLKESLDKIRLQFRQKVSNAVFFENVKTKLMYNKRHKQLLLKKGDKAYLKLHKK